MYKLSRPSSPLNMKRNEWYNQRQIIEKNLHEKTSKKRKIIQKTAHIFPVSLFDSWGRKNSLNIQHNKVDFAFENLPASFDGFSILHISDLHFGASHELDEAIHTAASQVKADLTVLTGDYQFGYGQPPESVYQSMNKLIKTIDSSLPILAILGNHDRTEMVQRLENSSLLFLTNELISIKKENDEILIYGIDEALLPQHFSKKDNHFGICLGHNVEYAENIAKNNWDLMLAGHSHGGQICLPLGRPIFLSVDYNRHIAIEKWKAFDMQGYTSKGCGTSTLPWRFNCHGQITSIYLKKI